MATHQNKYAIVKASKFEGMQRLNDISPIKIEENLIEVNNTAKIHEEIPMTKSISAEYYTVDTVSDTAIINFLYLDQEIEEDEQLKTYDPGPIQLVKADCSLITEQTNLHLKRTEIINKNLNADMHEIVIPDYQKGNINIKSFKCGKCNRSVSISDIGNSNKKKIVFQCQFCNLLFRNQRLMQEHDVKVHDVISTPCSHCITEFCKQSQLKVGCNSNAIRAKCAFCDKEFKRLYDLKIHLNAHLDIRSHVCDVCEKSFSHSSNLIHHKRIHTGEKPYVCKICRKGFIQVPALIGHMLSHTDGISCTLCCLKFKSVNGIIKHTNNTHNYHISSKLAYEMANLLLDKQINIFQHAECTKNVKDKEIYNDSLSVTHSESTKFDEKKHILPSIVNVPITLESHSDNEDLHLIAFITDNHGVATRSWTDKEFSTEFSPLKLHSVSELLSRNENQNTSDPEDVINFDTYSELREFFDLSVPSKLEYDNKSYDASRNYILNNKYNNCNGKLTCIECGKSFAEKRNYEVHLSVHNPSLRKYSCSQCEEKFTHNSSLQRHLTQHGISVNYACPTCAKTYKSPDALRQHKNRVHKRKVNYACPYCTKVFFATTEYKYHLRLHKKESPFMCSSCGKTFSHVSHLHRHEKIHSGVKPHTCSYCPKAFIQACELRRHTKRHTKKLNTVSHIVEQSQDGCNSNADAICFVFVADDIQSQIGQDSLSILNVNEV